MNSATKIKQAREATKRQKRLLRLTSQAIANFNLIEAHDRVMVCVSGGKDSLTLLHILEILRRRAPIPFTLIAMNLDQGQPGFPSEVLPQHFEQMGMDYHIETQNTYRVVKRVIPEGKTQCGLCSRLRRGIIYRVAKELKVTKIALGHHRDDILATFFLNLFFAGQLKTMPVKLRSDDGQHLVIRPLSYCEESDCADFAKEQDFPIIPCTLCSDQTNLQRAQMRDMIELWKKKHPGRVNNIFRALGQVKPEFLLDPKLFDFSTLLCNLDSSTDTAWFKKGVV